MTKMIGLDTTILARYYIDEENPDTKTLQQRQIAKSIIESTKVLFIAKTVIIDFEWVLRGVYKFPVEAVLSVFEHICQLSNTIIEDRAIILKAIEYTKAGIECTDALHLASYYKCSTIASFDKKFARLSNKNGFLPSFYMPK